MFESQEIAEDINNASDAVVSKYYHGWHWGQCLELLRHLCQYSENILLVSGPKGIGKSAIKQEFINNDNGLFKCSAVEGNSSLSILEVMSKVADGFGLAFEKNDRNDSNNNNNILSNKNFADATSDKTWVLLVDNADLLSDEIILSLVQLANTKHGQDSRVHLVFLGTNDFEDRLSSLMQTKGSSNLQMIELEPLSFPEMESYLLYKWRIAGNRSDLPFDKSVLKKIYVLSKGVPYDVERFAKARLAGSNLDRPNFIVQAIKSVPPVIVGLLLFIGLAFVFVSILWPDNGQPDNSQNDNLEEKLDIPIEVVPVSIIKEPGNKNPDPDPVLEPDSGSELELEQTKKITEITEDIAKQEVELKLQMTLKLAAEEKRLTSELESRIKAREEKLRMDLESKIQAEYAAHKKQQEKIIAEKTKIEEQKIEEQKIEDPRPVAVITSGENILLNKPNNNYTLQLLGTSSEDNARKFIVNNKLIKQAQYFMTKYHGKTWFIVVLGDYVTRDKALQAIEKMPQNIKDLKPWPREFSAVKQSINKKRS